MASQHWHIVVMLREKLEPDLGVLNYPRKAKKAASRSESTLVLLLTRSQARMSILL
jgi:hypothetical protein